MFEKLLNTMSKKVAFKLAMMMKIREMMGVTAASFVGRLMMKN